jgi:hypothetical protein
MSKSRYKEKAVAQRRPLPPGNDGVDAAAMTSDQPEKVKVTPDCVAPDGQILPIETIGNYYEKMKS